MLRVSENHRYLVHDDGSPFFYLGDTAWELFHRLDRRGADRYLEHRAAQGFTVIQAVVLGELKGLKEPNANGDLPFVDRDIARPNEAYFAHVDYIVDKAASSGLHIGMLPTWGSHVGVNWEGSAGKHFIDAYNARGYGRFLGRRYGAKPIIWILGGDRPAEGNEEVWGELAAGLRDGDGGRCLMTYHPPGSASSSDHLGEAAWLDFNMIQSGHSMNRTNFSAIGRCYRLSPVRPCMDAEPTYEYPPNDMPEGLPVDAYQVRLGAYWGLFAGSFGHTYGTHPIWQMYAPPHEPKWNVHTCWYDAMDLPGALQMKHAKALMLSRPFLTRIPDPSLIRSGMGWVLDHVQAARDGTPKVCDATYIMAYFPQPRRVLLNGARIAGDRLRVWWFDPRSGQARDMGQVANQGIMEFGPPSQTPKEDWVLVIDDVRCNYGPPGT